MGCATLGQPDKLGRHLHQAFDKMALCAPIRYAETPRHRRQLHGAACPLLLLPARNLL